MNKVIFSITNKYLNANKKKTWLSRISMILMVALLTCVFVGKDSVVQYMENVASMSYGKWHVAFYDVNQQEYEKIKQLDYIDHIAVSENLDYTLFSKSQNKSTPFLNLRYYQQEMFDWNNIQVIEGRLPENDQEIVLSNRVKEDGSSIQIGDTIETSCFKRLIENFGTTTTMFPFLQFELKPNTTLEAPAGFPYFDPEVDKDFYATHKEIHEDNGFQQDFTIVGFISVPDYELGAKEAYTAISLLSKEAVLHQDTFNGMYTIDTSKAAPIWMDMNDILGQGRFSINNKVLAFSGSSSDSGLNSIILIAQIFFILLITTVSLILIYNIFQLSYDERRTFLAMISAVGATAKQKRSSIYAEALLHLLYALPLGILVGFLLIYGGMTLLKPYTTSLVGLVDTGLVKQNGVPITLKIKGVSLLMVVLFSAITTLLSSLLPAKKIAQIGVIDSIRGNENQKVKKGKKEYKNAEAMLAHAFERYEKRKNKSIIRAIVGFWVILFTISYATTQILQMVEYKLDANAVTVERIQKPTAQNEEEKEYVVHFMSNPNQIIETVYNELQKTNGIRDIDYYGEVFFAGGIDENYLSEEYKQRILDIVSQYVGEDNIQEENSGDYLGGFEYFNAMIIDDSIYAELAKSSDKHLEDIHCMLYNQAEISTKNYMVGGSQAKEYRFYEVSQATNIHSGDKIKMKQSIYDEEKDILKEEEKEVTVEAVLYKEDLEKYFKIHSERMWFIFPQSEASFIDPHGNGFTKISFIVNESIADTSEIMQRLQVYSEGDNPVLYLSRGNETQDGLLIISSMINIIMIVFTIIVSIISLLNIFNSLSSLMAERRKETAMLRSIGMSKKQIKNTYRKEIYIILMKSLCIALPIILVLSYIIHTLMMNRFGSFTVRFPYALMGLIFLIALGSIICIEEMILQKEIKGNIMDELRKSSDREI